MERLDHVYVACEIDRGVPEEIFPVEYDSVQAQFDTFVGDAAAVYCGHRETCSCGNGQAHDLVFRLCAVPCGVKPEPAVEQANVRADLP